MTHLYIEQTTGSREDVTKDTISKLYRLASSGDLDQTSDLKGWIHTDSAYRTEVNYLTTKYQDLTIDTDSYAIPFEDPNMLDYLLNLGIGSNGIISETDAANATVVANSANTTVTKFNELKYFTGITTSKGGLYSSSTGVIKFSNWTALEEVDISNFTSIGHTGNSGYEDTFSNCTSLKKVTASSNLTALGVRAFGSCSNLEDIIGLSGDIALYGQAFNSCKKLKQSNFDSVTTFSISGSSNFRECELLTSLTLSESTTSVPDYTFYGCTSLQSVTGLSDVTSIGKESFRNCPQLTTLDIDWSKITTIGDSAFSNCQNLTINNLAMPNLTSIGSSAFNNTNVKTVSNLSSIAAVRGFNNCKNLTSVVLPDTCTKIQNSAFYGCTSLNTINLSKIQYVEDKGLAKTGLTSLTFSDGFKAFQGNAFQENSNVTSITFPSSLTQVWENGNPILGGSTGLKNLDINTGSTALQTVTVDSSLDIEQLSIGGSINVSMTVPTNVVYIYWTSNGAGSGVLTFTNNSRLQCIGRAGQYNRIAAFNFNTTHTEQEWLALGYASGTTVEDNHCRTTFQNFPKNNLKYIPPRFQRENSSKNNIMDIIGDNVVGIGADAFNAGSNTVLSYGITLPSTLQYIGNNVFGGLIPTSYTFKGTTPPIVSYNNHPDEIFFTYSNTVRPQSQLDSLFQGVPIYVPSASVGLYQDAFPRLASYIQADPNE